MCCRYQEYNLKDADLAFYSSVEFKIERERPTEKEELVNDPRSAMIEAHKENKGSWGYMPSRTMTGEVARRPGRGQALG